MRSRSATPTRVPNLHAPRLTIFQDGVGEHEDDHDLDDYGDDDDNDGNDKGGDDEVTAQINHVPGQCMVSMTN